MSTPPVPGVPQPQRDFRPDSSNGVSADSARRKKLNLIAFILALAIVSLLLRLVYYTQNETRALMFVGIPTVLAVLMALSPAAKHPVGIAARGVTIGLLISAILFGEGVICVLMAAPIAYIIAISVAFAVSRSRPKGPAVMGLALLPFICMSLEGVSHQLSFPREQTVQVERLVTARPDQVEAILAGPMNFHTRLPVFLRMGFPRPVSSRGTGLELGTVRRIHFAGGEGHPGDLVMRVESRDSSAVIFRAVEDHSKIAHWLTWHTAEVRWRAVDANHTAVTWTLRYRRGLDPAWYFVPWEQYGARLAAGCLIDNLATPQR
jgi:hypothetical protein